MNIDIDIRVSGDDGEKLQTVSRHFSGKFDDDLNWGEGIDNMGRSFDTFLAEFLTFSGRIFRQTLLYGNRKAHNIKGRKEKEEKETEVSYIIRFGSGQKVEGRIPILKSIQSANEKGKKKQKSSGRKTKKYGFKSDKPEDFIDYFMQKAVESYESNFVLLGGKLKGKKEMEG